MKMDEQPRTMDIAAASAAQRKHQQENGYPAFAPSNGTCWNCGHNIYEDVDAYTRYMGIIETSKGYSVERAGSELITGCPHCHHSYCD